MKKIALKNAARGTAFDYAGQSWILLISTHAPLRGATHPLSARSFHGL